MLMILYVMIFDEPKVDTLTSLFIIDAILVELIGMAIGYYLGAK